MKRIVLLLLTIAIYSTCVAKIIYVNPAATGANNGTSWTDAYTSFILATWRAQPNDEIHLASGIYKEDYIDLEHASIRGSFDPLTNKQDFKAHPTIITVPESRPYIHFRIGGDTSFPSEYEVVVEGIQFYNTGRSEIRVINRARIMNCSFIDAPFNNALSFTPDFSMPPLLTVVNCTFTNSPDSTEALIADNLATSHFINCSILNNSSKAVCFRNFISHTKLTNCIVWGPSDKEITCFANMGSCTFTLNRNIIASLDPGIPLVMTNPAMDNRQVDPGFNDPANGDLSLQSTSPAINSGDSTVLASYNITHDKFGLTRKSGCAIDLGAQEYQFPAGNEYGQLPDANGILYVNIAGNYDIWGDKGSSWSKAQPSIDTAIRFANTCSLVKEIRIASGRYVEGQMLITRPYDIRGSFIPGSDQQDWVTQYTQIEPRDTTDFLLDFDRERLWDTTHMEGIRFKRAEVRNRCTMFLSHCTFTNAQLANIGVLRAVNCQFINFSDAIPRLIFNLKGNIFTHFYLINCSILNNSQSPTIINSLSRLWISNSIVWGIDGNNKIYSDGELTLNRNIIRHHIETNAWFYYNTDSATDSRNIDPRFKDPDNGDLRLLYGSPALNMGNNDLYEEADIDITNNSINTDLDMAGKKRVHNTSIDLGAFERLAQPQTINVADITATYGDGPVAPVVTVNSTQPVQYIGNNNDIASIFTDTDNKQKIRFGNKGLVTIKAAQEGNEEYDPSDTVSFTVTVNPKPITITADGKSKTYGEADPALTYTIAPALINNDVLSGSITRAAGQDAGAYPITQGNLINNNYNISFVPGMFTINKATQHITWNQQLLSLCDGSKTIALTGITSSGLPVQYVSANTAVANVAGNQLTTATAGFTTITATQPGNNNYQPAANVTQPFLVKLPAHLIVKHWNDVLLFDNSSVIYSNWQWYKNGSLVSGATGQYYYESGNLNGEYYATVKTTTGETLPTCPVNITPGITVAPMTAFPNPTAPGQPITVKTTYTAAQLQGATITVTNHTGTLISTQQSVTQQTSINMPLIQGLYVVRLKLTSGATHAITILVKQ